ncbi:MAG: glycosyltransferase [Planctomycetes bacterium]|nr:glycosyltransferase [Planctomycetota bacterium]
MVTWLMPVLNGMPYLPATLDSIARQTYPYHQLHVWDNGSTDGTLEELKRWIPSRIPGRIVTGRPMGASPSRAALVEEATTELCAVIDADDINLPTRLEEQVRVMSERPEIGVLGSWHGEIDDQGNEAPEIRRLPHTDAELRWQILFRSVICHSSVMFRRSAVLKAGNYQKLWFPSGHDIAQDAYLWLRAALVTGVANLPKKLVLYRIHARSTTGRFGREAAEGTKRSVEGLVHNFAPGMPLDRWDRIYHLLRTDYTTRVRWRDLGFLREAAVAVARGRGKPDNYFLSTSYYRWQRRYLRSRWARGLPVVSQLWSTAAAAKRLATRGGGASRDATASDPLVHAPF